MILNVAVDVQHAWRPWPNAGDRGSSYTTAQGLKVSEVSLALGYARVAVRSLRQLGANVLTNRPPTGILTGPYSRRAFQAQLWGAHAYLACHVNAGRGTYALTKFAGEPTDRGMDWYHRETLAHDLSDAISETFVGILRRPARSLELNRGMRGYSCVGELPPAIAGVLVEPFFGDDPTSLRLIGTPDGLTRLGNTIARAVWDWWQTIGQVQAPLVAARD